MRCSRTRPNRFLNVENCRSGTLSQSISVKDWSQIIQSPEHLLMETEKNFGLNRSHI